MMSVPDVRICILIRWMHTEITYEVLSHMYFDRKDHKLDEWREFCLMIETLPYSQIITLKGD